MSREELRKEDGIPIKSELREDKKGLKPEKGITREAEEEKEEIGGEKEAEEEAKLEEAIKKRTVIVDSNEKTLDESISALRKGEYNVIGVESAQECLEFLTKTIPVTLFRVEEVKLPDLLIIELDLKDADGWKLIADLTLDSKNYLFREVPIIVLTDIPITVETVKKMMAERIHDYISKSSVKGTDLLKKIDQYFETREKLENTKKRISKISFQLVEEYERIYFAIRIRLKYINFLKKELERLKEEGGNPSDIKGLEEDIYLQNYDVVKYEKRRREIKKMTKKVKKDDRGAETQTKAN